MGKRGRGISSPQLSQVSQQNIEVQLSDGSWQKVRRVSVKLAKPTRDGDVEIPRLTNLASTVAARKIADAYRLSCDRLADKMLRMQGGLGIAIDPEQWSRYCTMSLQEFTSFWTDVAERAKLARFRKQARDPNKPVTPTSP